MFILPDLKRKCSGWIDHDRKVLTQTLTLNDKLFYLEERLELIFFRSMDAVFDKKTPNHHVVNSSNMSFYLLGTTLLCCVIEAMGAFLLGSGSNQTRGINSKRFKAFIDSYLPRWKKTTKKGTSLPEWMWKNLRNALAHSLSISSGGMAHLGKLGYREKIAGKIEIHVEELYRDFKKGFDIYISDIKTVKNKQLTLNFEARFKEIFI